MSEQLREEPLIQVRKPRNRTEAEYLLRVAGFLAKDINRILDEAFPDASPATVTAPVGGVTDPHGHQAFSLYLEDCEKNAIEPDAAGAFHWLWTHHPALTTAARAAEPINEVTEALKDAVAHLAGAASAYRTYAKRHASQGKALADPFFSTRIKDFDAAVDRGRAALTTVARAAEPAQRVIGSIHIDSTGHPYARLTHAYDANGNGWTEGTQLIAASPTPPTKDT